MRLRGRVDGVVAVCAVVLFGFPAAVVWLASRQPVVPAAQGALVPMPEPKPAPALRDVPVLTGAAGARDRRRPIAAAALRTAVDAQIDRLFDERAAARLRRYLRGPPIRPPSAAVTPFSGASYPYRYVGLDGLLDGALPASPRPAEAAAQSRLGALLALAQDAGLHPNAGRVAYAILDRARAAGACDAQLNLAFLLAVSTQAGPEDVGREFVRAEAACPSDPTAPWLHGQWLSVRDRNEGTAAQPGSLAVFARLQRRFPGSAAGWSGQADALLRMAYDASEQGQPFTARSRFARALALYERARSLDRDPELAAGEARALAGRQRYGEAWRVQARAAWATGRPAALQARLVEYLEGAGRFGPAAREARRLAAGARFPHGTALTWSGGTDDEDSREPLSLGAGRLRPVSLVIAPYAPYMEANAPAAVADYAFIPAFRDAPGLTGTARWCPGWARARDLVLAGRAAAALTALPTSFRAARPDEDCSHLDEHIPLLRAVALAEAGRRERAIAAMRGVSRHARRAEAGLYEERQNLWRFAGRWEVAARLTDRWTRATPWNPRAFDRAGEVAFLRGDHAAAARLFGRSARLRREQTTARSVGEAQEAVKQGAALKLAERSSDALRVLENATDIAARALAEANERAYGSADATVVRGFRYDEQPTEITAAAAALYHAHAQAADVLLRRRRFADAIEHYTAAGQHAAGDYGDESFSVEALRNNHAIAEIYRGNGRAARHLANRAVAADPMNPLFLSTAGFALARQGRPVQAGRRYGRAVASDPTLYPAWNDLGVMLARSGRDDDALAAFRRAIGARDDYATAWFNLGVLLERRGLLRAVAAQGALGRAFALEPDLAKRRRQLVTDERLYFTELDLAKPLPPEWDFASSQQQTPLAATGLTLLLLLGLQGARAAGGRGLTGGASKWLDAARRVLARLPGALNSFAPAAVAVAVTIGVFLWQAMRDSEDRLAGLALFALGLIALIALVMRARVLVARRLGVTLVQRGWRPAILVALAAAPFGLPWAPLPIAETDRPEPRVHLAGPVVAAATGLVLLILSAWLHVPLTRSLGIAAIIMAASMLTPVKPLDGGHLAGATGALTAGAALGGTALLVALGLL
ncbi:MAG: hypothetical protein Q8K79_08995 [Solirubrobacteraceae bacterium]|nr:hypothetical protein [Solirubrobacteraceae bacterium]